MNKKSISETQYVTAKDLPMAPKGTPVDIQQLEIDANPLCKIYLNQCLTSKHFQNGYNDPQFYLGKYRINDVIKEGWIEEKQPLTIYANLYEDGLSTGQYYSSENKAIEGRRPSDYIRTVKFVEAENN